LCCFSFHQNNINPHTSTQHRSVVVTLQAFVDRTTQSVNILHPNNVFDNFIMVARIFALILFYSKISDADFRRW